MAKLILRDVDSVEVESRTGTPGRERRDFRPKVTVRIEQAGEVWVVKGRLMRRPVIVEGPGHVLIFRPPSL